MKKTLVILGSLLLSLTMFAGTALARDINLNISTDQSNYSPGETVNLSIYAYYDGGSAVTSIDKAEIDVYNQRGSKVLDDGDLNRLGNGNFSYAYNLSSSAGLGEWQFKITIEDRDDNRERKYVSFDVVEASSGGGGTTPPPVDPPPATGDHSTLTWSDYPSACVACHLNEFNEMAGSTHYKWVGESPDMTNQPEALQGKLTNAVNSYCINILGDWKVCGKCHVGRGLRPDDTQAGLENIDCLMCHNAAYAMERNRLADGSMGPVSTDAAVLDGFVQNIAKPTRANCLKCHANAGGGDAVKRGDLAMANIANTNANFDVHMNTTGTDLSCQSCHTFNGHKVIGKGSDLRPTDDLARGAEVKCTTCHTNNPHGSSYTASSKISNPSDAFIRDRHASEGVACQTCHIPTFGKVATEIHRDWTHHHDGSVADVSTGPGHPHADKQADVVPEYLWWDRTSENALLGDDASLTYDAEKGTYPTSRPNGSFKNGKIYPFKYKTAYQPMVSADDRLLALDTLVYLAQTGDVTQAIESGLANQGYPTDEPVKWVTTDTYQLINHGVEPGSNVGCTDCHDGSGETSNGRLDFNALGYHTWPAKVKNCTLCHGSENMGWKGVHNKHAEEMGKNCVACHTTEPTGWIEPPTRDGLCNNCHSGETESDSQKLHEKHAEAEHGGMNTTCTDCHTF